MSVNPLLTNYNATGGSAFAPASGGGGGGTAQTLLIPGTPANSNWTRQLAPIQSQFQPGVPPLLEGGVSVGDAWGFWVSNPEFPINSGDFDNLGVGGLYVVPNGQYTVNPGSTVPCINAFAGPGQLSQMVISSGDPAQPINIACSEILTSNTNLQISSINGAAPGVAGVSQIIAGSNVSIDPVGGTGAVTINASGGTLGRDIIASTISLGPTGSFGGAASVILGQGGTVARYGIKDQQNSFDVMDIAGQFNTTTNLYDAYIQQDTGRANSGLLNFVGFSTLNAPTMNLNISSINNERPGGPVSQSGFSLVAEGSTTLTVTVGGPTPAANGWYVNITPTSNPGAIIYWATSVNTTTFSINLSAAAPAGGLAFYWMAEAN
jgi:hypothetical protein